MKKVLLFFVSLIIFSFWIYFFKNYFLWGFENDLNNYIEENYIDHTIEQKTNSWEKLNSANEKQENTQKLNDVKKTITKIKFFYFPSEYNLSTLWYTNLLKLLLYKDIFNSKIDKLSIEFHEDKYDTRWKMRNRSILLFWIKKLDYNEFSSVSIHEFWHYLDLYFLKKQVVTDFSDFFYNISWQDTNIIKPWLTQNDFVSWYAMSNKYEDFAETFTYYFLHNDDFLERTKSSDILKKKYDFFSKYIFRWVDISKLNFWLWWKIELYYRDITKINYSIEKLLDFLKN